MEDEEQFNRTLLMAAENGFTKVAETMLNLGASVHTKDEYGETPLYKAARTGHREICKLLIDNGADVNVTEKFGETPLHGAAAWKHSDVCYLLIKRGAATDLPGHDGRTAYEVAEDNGMTDTCKMMEARVSTGPLHVVCRHRYLYKFSESLGDWERWYDETEDPRVIGIFCNRPSARDLERIGLKDALRIGDWLRRYFGGDGKLEHSVHATPGTCYENGAACTVEVVYDGRAKVEVDIFTTPHTPKA